MPNEPTKSKNEDGTDSDEVEVGPVQQSFFDERAKHHVQKEEELDQHLQQTCPTAWWEQCTATLQNTLRTVKDHEGAHNKPQNRTQSTCQKQHATPTSTHKQMNTNMRDAKQLRTSC